MECYVIILTMLFIAQSYYIYFFTLSKSEFTDYQNKVEERTKILTRKVHDIDIKFFNLVK
jgi:hypothetical protein